MKERNVWLSPEELQHMLYGSLQWGDVASRITSSKTTGIRKLSEAIPEKQSDPLWTEPKPKPKLKSEPKPKLKSEPESESESEPELELELELDSKRLEGQPVIWLLGSVGLLTLSSWFYFVLFAK